MISSKLTFLISSAQETIWPLLSNMQPSVTIIITLILIWSGLVVFYLLFFYAVGESSDSSDEAKLRDSLKESSSLNISTEKQPEGITIQNGDIVIKQPGAITIQDPNRTETSAQELMVQKPSLVIVEMDSSVIIEGPEAIFDNESDGRSDSITGVDSEEKGN